jgi:hypothetical protein
MTVPATVRAITASGVRLSVAWDGRLRFYPKGLLEPEELAFLRENRTAVIAVLRAESEARDRDRLVALLAELSETDAEHYLSSMED